MTAKSKRKDKRSVPKTMGKGASIESETIDRGPLDTSADAVVEGASGAPAGMVSHVALEASAHAVREGAFDTSAEAIGQTPFEASMVAVSESFPNASAVMMPSGGTTTGGLHEKGLTESTTTHARVFQGLFQEWFEFAGMRMRQHMHLIQAIQESRSLPDLQQAYSQFWQNAYTQYGEETQRMLLITREAVDGVYRASHQNVAAQATLH